MSRTLPPIPPSLGTSTSSPGLFDTRDTKIAALRLKFNAFKALEDVKEDNKTNSEFIADLNAEYHEKALLENQKRFYKRCGRVGSARKPMDKSK
nr:hypothetical protein [Tanacetum cinerariifolium]